MTLNGPFFLLPPAPTPMITQIVLALLAGLATGMLIAWYRRSTSNE